MQKAVFQFKDGHDWTGIWVDKEYHSDRSFRKFHHTIHIVIRNQVILCTNSMLHFQESSNIYYYGFLSWKYNIGPVKYHSD